MIVLPPGRMGSVDARIQLISAISGGLNERDKGISEELIDIVNIGVRHAY
jgi:hypothetical protein